MSILDYREAALVFAGTSSVNPKGSTGEPVATPVSGGLINHSYKVNGNTEPAFLLQQINQNVFKDPTAVQENFMNIWTYSKNHPASIELPEPLNTPEGNTLFKDSRGNFRRAFRFIEEGTTRDVAGSPEEAFTTAQTFGHFTASLQSFATAQLHAVIPNFHNLSYRYRQFEQAVQTAGAERKEKAATLIRELQDRKKYKAFYETVHNHPEQYRIRVMHHDAKIANVLFHRKSGEVICAVDFDTVMPGHYFSDLGDMIRSMACSLDESSTDFAGIHIREEIYNAIVKGYLSVMEPLLTPSEKKHIHHAGIFLIYMQALRFLTDYLEQDRYYRIQHPEQNKDRAQNQLVLLQHLESFLRDTHHYSLEATD